MRDFALLFKVLIKNADTRSVTASGRARLPKSVTLLLTLLPVSALFSVMMSYAVATGVTDVGALATSIAGMYTTAQLFGLFFSLTGALTVLYSASDIPFLSTLPIKPTSIFFAKFLTVYLNMLEITATLSLPPTLAMGVTYHIATGGLFAGFYPLALIASLLSALIPLFIIVLISMPLSYIGSFMKGRQTLRSILTVIIYALFMCAYVIVIYVLNMGDASASKVLPTVSMMGYALYPNVILSRLLLGINGGLNLLYTAAIFIGILALSLLLAKLFYNRIISKKLETKLSTSAKAASFKEQGIIPALLKKDFITVLRNPQMAISHFANLLLSPVFVTMMYFTSLKSTSSAGHVSEFMAVAFVLMYSMIFGGASNMFAAYAYTREGRSFHLTRSLPVSAKESVIQKLLLANLVPLPINFVNFVIALALYRVHVANAFLYFVATLLAVLGATSINIYADMRGGNVNWKNKDEMNAAGQANHTQLVTVLISIGVAIVQFLAAIALGITASVSMSTLAAYAIFWAVIFVTDGILAFVGLFLLFEKGVPMYETLTERSFRGRQRKNKIKLGGGYRGGLLK